MSRDFDLAIVGSGFGGSLLAMIACRLGLRVLLLERGKHPRFAIGESTSPLANLLLEELALRYDLPRLLPLTEYGPWKRTYPQVTCGLKRGFTYYHHEAGKPFRRAEDRSDQLLVAASPHDEVSDMHWLRADVDQFLMQEAVDAGAEYLDETLIEAPVVGAGGARLSGTRKGARVDVSASLLVDATGPRGFLSRTLSLPDSAFAGFPATQTLFTHFTGVRRCDQMDAFRAPGTPPFPPDDAALHHIFDGGWMWVLRFDDGVTSAGVSLEDKLAQELGVADGATAWQRVVTRFPSVREQFEQAEAILPFVYSPRLSYRCARAAGEGWAMLPSAAAFVDPLFSTGIPLTLLGIARIAAALEESWGSDELGRRLRKCGEETLSEADWTARFIGACFATMDSFPHFAAFSMFYFAGASFSEMARRVGRTDLAPSFLGRTNRAFARGLTATADLLHDGSAGRPEADVLAAKVCDAVEQINVAGLCQPVNRNWYGVDLEDVVRGSEKLGLSADLMREIIRNAAWSRGPA